MANDVYAFAVLAWEARTKFLTSLDTSLNRIGFVDRYSLDKHHSPTKVSSRELTRCRMDADRLDLTTMKSQITCGK